MQANSNFRPHL